MEIDRIDRFFTLPAEMILRILLPLPVEDIFKISEISPFSIIVQSAGFRSAYMKKPPKILLLANWESETFLSLTQSEGPRDHPTILARPVARSPAEDQEEDPRSPDEDQEQDDVQEPISRILGTWHGLVCLLRERIFIWNPNTGECSPYLPFPETGEFILYGFCAGTQLTSPFLIVGSIGDFRVFDFKTGDWNWKSRFTKFPCIREADQSTMRGVYSNGCLYWLASSTDELAHNKSYDRILKFSIADEKFFEVLPPPLPDLKFITYLTDLQGKLGIVYTNIVTGQIDFHISQGETWTNLFRVSHQETSWGSTLGLKPLMIDENNRIIISSIYHRGLQVLENSDYSHSLHPHANATKISLRDALVYQPSMRLPTSFIWSCCSMSQWEEAFLFTRSAATDSDCKVHLVQRGAVRPLIEVLLESSDAHYKERSAFALGRLAQETHYQAGIAHDDGLLPLLKLLDSKNGSLQHNAAFALYGLVDNEDNVSDFIRMGGVQKMQDGEFIAEETKDSVAKTLKRLEDKIHGRVLNHLLYLMRVADEIVQRRVALALAHLCSPDDQRTIFIDNNGLEFLLELLGSNSPKQQLDGAVALYKISNKAMTLSPVDAAPPSPTPQVYLGELYVNSASLSDVTFLIEGRRFYAHRICLTASSDSFRAIFDGCYQEKDARDIEIPNIRWEVFELMMRFIYTGSVDVTLDIAQDLLRAADQYLLEGLKRLCEYTIAQDISLENVSSMYELSEAFHAISLRHTCILFILQQFDKLIARPGHAQLIQRIIPEIQNYFATALTKPNPHNFRL